MLFSTFCDCECSGFISLNVLYHTTTWLMVSEAVTWRLYMKAIILFGLGVAFIVSQSTSQQYRSGNYRPQASHSLMLIFLVPLCVLMDAQTVMVNSDLNERYDGLWLSLSHLSVIVAKYTTLHGRYPSLAFSFVGLMTFCLLLVASFWHVIFFIVSACFLWKCIDIIPSTFPRSFSFGEIAIILQLFCNWIGRMTLSTYDQIVINDSLRLKWTGSTIVAAVFVATMMTIIFKAYRSLYVFALMYMIHAGMAIAFLTWMFQENFLLWLFSRLFQNYTGLTLLISWMLLLMVTVSWTVSRALVVSSASQDKSQRKQDASPVQSSSDETSNIIVSNSSISYNTRKVFHLFILLVYIPGLLLDPQVLFLASCVAFGAFIIFEVIRSLHVPVVGDFTDYILRPFTDERDQGPLFLTHIYLLVGLSLPLWITTSSYTELSSPLRFYSGVLALGIGDTIACVVGTAFGKHRWPGTKKTVEGSFAAIAAQLIFVFVLLYVDVLPVHSFYHVWIGVTLTFLVEAFTDQIDNLVLPLFLFPFLCSS